MINVSGNDNDAFQHRQINVLSLGRHTLFLIHIHIPLQNRVLTSLVVTKSLNLDIGVGFSLLLTKFVMTL